MICVKVSNKEREIQEVLEYIRKECLPKARFTGIYNKMAILVFNAFGENDSQISERLDIKEQTIRTYKCELRKLGLLSEAEETIFSSENYSLELCLWSLIIQGYVTREDIQEKELVTG